MTAANEDRLVTASLVGRRLGVSKTTVLRRVESGDLPKPIETCCPACGGGRKLWRLSTIETHAARKN